MIKIKEYKITKKGIRGHTITLPKVWIDDLLLKSGDKIEFYRLEDDSLVLKATKK